MNAEAAVLNEVNIFLDHLFHHDNTPVFIVKRLIQRFTSSNPSGGYVQAVAEGVQDRHFQRDSLPGKVWRPCCVPSNSSLVKITMESANGDSDLDDDLKFRINLNPEENPDTPSLSLHRMSIQLVAGRHPIDSELSG